MQDMGNMARYVANFGLVPVTGGFVTTKRFCATRSCVTTGICASTWLNGLTLSQAMCWQLPATPVKTAILVMTDHCSVQCIACAHAFQRHSQLSGTMSCLEQVMAMLQLDTASFVTYALRRTYL